MVFAPAHVFEGADIESLLVVAFDSATLHIPSHLNITLTFSFCYTDQGPLALDSANTDEYQKSLSHFFLLVLIV